MVREFYIENEKGQRFSMMDIENGCFFNSPSGLGFSYDTQYTQIENNFIRNIRKLTQGSLGGELVFKNYDNYKKIIDFIVSTENLKFVYKVPFQNGFIEYFKDIDISNIDKTEIGTNGVLVCPVTFSVRSLWYEARETVYRIEKETNEITWDFEWDSKFSGYDVRNLTFKNEGHVEAPFLLEIDSAVSHPKITILDGNNNILNELQLSDLVIDTNEKLIYCTKDTDLKIYKESSSGKSNLFESLDLNKINFFKLPVGVSQIRLSGDSDITSAKLTIFVEYLAV